MSSKWFRYGFLLFFLMMFGNMVFQTYLVCGIDFEEGRSYSDTSSNDGMTDMILYCQFDIKGGALRMLQIPRNTLVTTQNRKLTLSNGVKV